MNILSTKSETEKQDEWSESRVKESPKAKPPRYDKRRKHYKEEDIDLDTKDKDLSMKNASLFIRKFALDFRGKTLNRDDVSKIYSKIGSSKTTLQDLPHIADETFRYISAKAHRINRSEDGRTFIHNELLPQSSGKESYGENRSFFPVRITETDLENILSVASNSIDPTLYIYNKDSAYRSALDHAIWSYEQGKYQGKIDSINYLLLLNSISNSNIDLTRETYIASTNSNIFNPDEYWGQPAKSHIDSGTTQHEKWRKMFEYGGVYEHDDDEIYEGFCKFFKVKITRGSKYENIDCKRSRTLCWKAIKNS